MKKVADGDNEAFARLYDEVKKGVFAFAYSYLRCAADAEDVTEEVFFAVKRKRICIGRERTRGRGYSRSPKIYR